MGTLPNGFYRKAMLRPLNSNPFYFSYAKFTKQNFKAYLEGQTEQQYHHCYIVNSRIYNLQTVKTHYFCCAMLGADRLLTGRAHLRHLPSFIAGAEKTTFAAVGFCMLHLYSRFFAHSLAKLSSSGRGSGFGGWSCSPSLPWLHTGIVRLFHYDPAVAASTAVRGFLFGTECRNDKNIDRGLVVRQNTYILEGSTHFGRGTLLKGWNVTNCNESVWCHPDTLWIQIQYCTIPWRCQRHYWGNKQQ